MRTMYKPKYFKLHELVDKETYENNPEWKIWRGLDERLLRVIDILREEIGVSITINNWFWGKDRQWSGLRNSSSPWYSTWSCHSYGRAVDMIFKGIPAVEVRKKIKELMQQGKFDGIVDSLTLEETVSYRDNGTSPLTWVHLSVMNNKPGYNEIYV